MKLRITLALLAIFAMFIAWGCSDDKPTGNNNNPGDTTGTATTVWNTAGYWDVSELNASAADHFIYYSFAQKDTVTLTDQQSATDSSWNIAFKRSTIILNGGASGSGDDKGVDLAAVGNPDSTNFAGFDNLANINESDYQSDSFNLIVDEWYSYNPSTHELSPTRNVYIMMDADGGYVKFQALGIDNPGQSHMGTITMLYNYAGSSPDFIGQPDTLVFTDSTGSPVYVDFSTGSIVNPADPRNSTDWDIAFTQWEVHQNNTVFGIGHAGTYEIWMEQTDPTDFGETAQAPTVPQAYFPDQLGSVLTDWYNYDGNTHTLTSKNHVYVINTGNGYYKLQITTYYKDINGSPVSGYYTFRWLELQ